MKQNAIIVDLDGTLCNADHRKHHIENKRWDLFYENLVHDEINQWCFEIITRMVGFTILFVSGRPEDHRHISNEWLSKYGLGHYPLFMRKADDYRKDSIIKEEIYRRDIEPKYNVIFCIDDRKQVVDMWRSIGLTCLQCDDGNF